MGWGYCWDDPWLPHTGATLTNTSFAIDTFAKIAHGNNVTAGVGLDECNKDNSKYKGENGVAAAGFRKGRRPGHMIAGWGANAGDEVFASLMADGTVDCESLSWPPPPNCPAFAA